MKIKIRRRMPGISIFSLVPWRGPFPVEGDITYYWLWFVIEIWR